MNSPVLALESMCESRTGTVPPSMRPRSSHCAVSPPHASGMYPYAASTQPFNRPCGPFRVV
eukprot:3115233-Rhodomonas_salina.2